MYRQLFVHGVTNSTKLLDLLKVSLLAVFCNKTKAPQDLHRRPAQGKGLLLGGVGSSIPDRYVHMSIKMLSDFTGSPGPGWTRG